MNVSHDSGIQAEVAVTVDPANDQVLLAGSNSVALTALGSLARVYGSTDGGATWTSTPGPPAARVGKKKYCNYGDPAVAIGRGGRQYYAFLSGPCLDFSATRFADLEFVVPALQVAMRPSPSGPWRPVRVFPGAATRFDDKPAVAVDASESSPHRDRVYVAWSRIRLRGPETFEGAQSEIVVSRSDDAGARWSRPVVVSDHADAGSTFAGIAVDRLGRVFVAWADGERAIWIDRSDDGGDRFGHDVKVDTAAALPRGPCGQQGEMGVPAQAKRCITPAPLVNLDDRAGSDERVYVTYGTAGTDGRQQDVFVGAFDRDLRPLLGRAAGVPQQVNPPDGAVVSDQFMPASAVDRSTGTLWVCFYDTAGDRRRERVFYSCTASADGGKTWPRPVRAASVPSKEAARAGLTLFEFQFGDFQGLTAANGVAHPIWTDTRDADTLSEEIYTTVLTDAQLQAG